MYLLTVAKQIAWQICSLVCNFSLWGEWSSGSRLCKQIGRFLDQTPLGAQMGFGTQPCCEVLGDLCGKTDKMLQ